MELRLDIDRLVLDGCALAPGDAARLADALRVELANLLAGAPPPRTASVPSLPPIDMSLGTDPAVAGRDLARALARALVGAP